MNTKPTRSYPRLSVNVNKIATLRNARGGSYPDVLAVTLDCVRFGAEGITVHPRPDGRHIRVEDVRLLAAALEVEFNVEGYPSADYMALVEEVRPTQATLVPDAPDALTSSAGWALAKHQDFLQNIVHRLKACHIRTSVFVDADPNLVQTAAQIGFDAMEIYTGPYAHSPDDSTTSAWLAKAQDMLKKAQAVGLRVHAGHDLNLHNLPLLLQHLKGLDEVSIGHALICDALYYGLENTIAIYRRKIQFPKS